MTTNAGKFSEEELREIGRRWIARLQRQLDCLSLPADTPRCECLHQVRNLV